MTDSCHFEKIENCDISATYSTDFDDLYIIRRVSVQGCLVGEIVHKPHFGDMNRHFLAKMVK